MNSGEFVSLVREMRNCQREYFSTRDRNVLIRSKSLEQRVDEALSGQITFAEAVNGGSLRLQITKGKWVKLFGSEVWAQLNTAEKATIPNVVQVAEVFGTNYKELDANVRLIAAAPELYEAVCNLLDYAYEALHLAGGENETRGKAPRILREIQEYQQLIDRVNGKGVRLDVADY